MHRTPPTVGRRKHTTAPHPQQADVCTKVQFTNWITISSLQQAFKPLDIRDLTSSASHRRQPGAEAVAPGMHGTRGPAVATTDVLSIEKAERPANTSRAKMSKRRSDFIGEDSPLFSVGSVALLLR